MNYLGKEISSKPSVLILDDDLDIVTLMKIGLQHHSFNVYAFTDPALALEHFGMNAKSYDLIISDIRMPQMNGFEFIKKVLFASFIYSKPQSFVLSKVSHIHSSHSSIGSCIDRFIILIMLIECHIGSWARVQLWFLWGVVDLMVVIPHLIF
jgi:response regulator RpfG family c-di-GMP phosphodiesterase